MKYYGMFVKEDKRYGIAYVPENMPLFLPPAGWVTDWQLMTLTLRDGEFSDYPANQRAFPLCSLKLRDIMDRCKGEEDVLQWLPVTVRREDGEERPYFVLHFPEEYDVLDKSKSLYYRDILPERAKSGPEYGDDPIKPVISNRLAGKHDIFSYVGGHGIMWYVSDTVRRTILREKCTGVAFERTASAD